MSRTTILASAAVVALAACQADRVLQPSLSLADPNLYYLWPTGGGNHTCVHRRDVNTYPYTETHLCWGDDSRGQVGNGPTNPGGSSSVLSPVAVVNSRTFGPGEGGGAFTCTVENYTPYRSFCWGDNTYGQLGNNSLTSTTSPVQVSTTATFVRITTGDNHACGLTLEGLGYCWGRNDQGQLGTNSTANKLVPTPIYAGRVWAQLAAGGDFTCGQEMQSWKVYCWGSNAYGQLGTADRTRRLYPSKAAAGQWHSLATGGHFACAIALNVGSAACWGDNSDFEIGTNEGSLHFPSWTSPQPVEGGYLYMTATLAAGYNFVCGVRSATESPYCWGRGTEGQMGDGAFTTRKVPTLVPTTHRFGPLIAGTSHIVGVNRDGSVVTWGSNAYGQLGTGNTTTTGRPVVILR
jgi:hypothetical protein